MTIQDPTSNSDELPKYTMGSIHPLDIYLADGQPGWLLFWPEDAQQAANHGVACAEKWLMKAKPKPLWTCWQKGRALHSQPFQLQAYDLGFMTRLQQRLRSQAST